MPEVDSNTVMMLELISDCADKSDNSIPIDNYYVDYTGTSSPFSGYSQCAYFGTYGGNRCSLKTNISSSSLFDFGTGDFTIDWWQTPYNPDVSSGLYTNNNWIMGSVNTQNYFDIWFELYDNLIYKAHLYLMGVDKFNNKGFWAPIKDIGRRWLHFAFVRYDDKLRFFIDGVSLPSYNDLTSTENITGLTSGIYINRSKDNQTPDDRLGISCFRVSDIARYWDDFHVPESPYSSTSYKIEGYSTEDATVYIYQYGPGILVKSQSISAGNYSITDLSAQNINVIAVADDDGETVSYSNITAIEE
jgi:hypothetical protein